MRIPRETIDLIRDRAGIEQIVKRYVPTLVKRGKNYLGLCPFHNEKTPSFTVSTEKQLFYCFGCHAGGNVFTFISKAERLTFPESVKFIGNLVGIEISEEKNENDSQYSELLRLNNMAMTEFHNLLKSGGGKTGLEYLKSRGVKDEAIDQFRLGYSPDSWSFLTDKIKNFRQRLESAEKIGLVSSSNKNNQKHFFDRYRNRVIFPIFDKNGKPVAFGGRVLGEGRDKYINSPESEIFKKRNILYGYNFAIESMRELKRAIIVEGYLDVIGCHQEGIKNVVAPLGTALSQSHVSMLSRECSEIILLFDSDSAGMNAAMRSLELFDQVSVDVKIAMLPEGDPFDYISKFGLRQFMSIVDSSLKPADFRISRIMNKKAELGPIKTMLALFGVVKEIKLESEKSLYLKKISSMLDIDENALRRDFDKFQKNMRIDTGQKAENINRTDYYTKSFGELIKLLLNHPAFISKAAIDFSEFEMGDGPLKNIYNKLMEEHSADGTFSADKMFDFFQDGAEFDFLNQSLGSGFGVENPDAAYNEIYISMKLHDIDRKINKYASLISRNASGDHDYIAEIEVLRREKEKYYQYIHK